MVGVAGLEPTVSGSKPDALPTWLYPCNIQAMQTSMIDKIINITLLPNFVIL